MKNILMPFLAILVLGLIVVASRLHPETVEDAEVIDETPAPIVLDEPAQIPDAKPLSTRSLDLDGDGKRETVSHYIVRDDVNGDTTILVIGEKAIKIPGHNPEDTLRFVDLNKADSFYEIAATDDGPSSDY